jgi:uronate dehydrogenase
VGKCFGESLSRYYFDKFAVESVCVRIGSCFVEPKDRRQLATWLSPRDFVSLVKAVFDAPITGHLILYGMSANRVIWWSNDHASFLGWEPTDSAESFRAKVETANPRRRGSIRQSSSRAAASPLPGISKIAAEELLVRPPA